MDISSRKTRVVITVTSLLLVVIFVLLVLSSTVTLAQVESTPTPTNITNNKQVILSGDTEGLILGAGIILFIILGGVILQRTILKDANQQTQEE
jgi:hypothetical protein